MYWDVKSVEPKTHLILNITFSDGLKGKVHFKPSHLTGIYAPLKDEHRFKQAYVDMGVVTWPGEIDLPPDTMYKEIKEHGHWILE